VFCQGPLKWNFGVHNTMVYLSGNIPSGTYDHTRLANLSFGWVAVDGGAGYTYLDPTSGREFSVVGGLTYNFMNQALQYQNGIDFHVDWGASQFIGKNVPAGSPAISFSSSPATAALAQRSAISRDVLGRRSVSFSRLARSIKAT
jgi:hypothetical protein